MMRWSSLGITMCDVNNFPREKASPLNCLMSLLRPIENNIRLSNNIIRTIFILHRIQIYCLRFEQIEVSIVTLVYLERHGTLKLFSIFTYVNSFNILYLYDRYFYYYLLYIIIASYLQTSKKMYFFLEKTMSYITYIIVYLLTRLLIDVFVSDHLFNTHILL